MVLSLALQHGTPIETIRHAVTRNGSGAAHVGHIIAFCAHLDGGKTGQDIQSTPDRQISRIRLSDKTSRFRAQRHLQPKAAPQRILEPIGERASRRASPSRC